MAHKYEMPDFLVIEGKAKDFLSIGFGAGGEMTTGTIEGGALDGFDLISFGGGGYLVCDNCNGDISEDDTCYYVSVLNMVLCKKCFEEWSEDAKWYESDAPIERRNYIRTKNELECEGLWE